MRCVDVVVDVPTTRLDGSLTYAVAGEAPPIGARVKIQLGRRMVGGWVISEPVAVVDTAALKPIESVEEGLPRFGAREVRLAGWLRRRYACTFREALAAVAPRGGAGTALAKYSFGAPPPPGNRIADALYRRFERTAFAPSSARRALRAGGLSVPASALQKELGRLVRLGLLRCLASQARKPVRARPDPLHAVLANVGAKGAAQRRLVRALAEAGGELPLPEAKRRARVAAQVIRRAVAGGSIELAGRGPGGRATLGADESFVATAEQRAAIETLSKAMTEANVALLHGITGSGKTFVYARVIERVRSAGGRAIVLVPEISLTPQTAARFAAAFGSKVSVLHSDLSDGERARVWQDAEKGNLDVVVGARSAVFAPLPNLKLIVIDEEHEPSYKQDVAPRYDAAAVARERMAREGGSVLLGSATPSLESYWEAKSGAIRYVRLEKRATAAPLPPVEVVDMTAEQTARGRRPLGSSLVSAIDSALANGEKIMLFVNRRGYAGLLLCRACGFVPKCRRCAVSLVLHTADQSMRCHVCGAAFRAPSSCPKCRSLDLRPFGFGTQRVEQEVRELFPAARIVRMDSDTTATRGAHGALLDNFASAGDVLIGTQMIAKGLDFPTLTVVGVVAADVDLHRPDFRAAERTFQLLTQVAGRAGRASAGSRVVVQTYSAGHYAIELAALHDYEAFAEKELALRRELKYPPFGRLVSLEFAGAALRELSSAAGKLAERLRADLSDLQVLGPAPDPLPKARGEFRLRVAVKADSEERLMAACEVAQAMKQPAGVRLTVVVDPR